jgi:hypothetical protein
LYPVGIARNFSDGFQDQFGGAENRKIMSKNFEKMLRDLSRFPCAEFEKQICCILKIGAGKTLKPMTCLSSEFVFDF